MRSAYDRLQERYGKDKVRFGNPVGRGQRPARLGLVEITDTIDAMTAAMPESTLTTTAAMRCEALKLFLERGDTVYIKTATGVGHARFWSRRAGAA